MVWGAPAVPAMGTLSLVLLGAILALIARHAIRRGVSARRTGLLAAAVAVGMAWSAWAQSPPSLPFTFTNGTVADASQVNANFNFLANAVTLVQSEIPPLQTQGLPRTRVLTIPALAFTPATVGDTRYVLNNNVALRKTAGSTGTMVLNAPVYLPDGAVITQLSATVLDTNTTAGENVQVQLLDSSGGSFSPGATTVPTLNSDSIQPTTNFAVVNSPPVNEAVETSARALFIQVTFSGTSGNALLNIVQIQYRY
jgi:hypothetical protein